MVCARSLTPACNTCRPNSNLFHDTSSEILCLIRARDKENSISENVSRIIFPCAGYTAVFCPFTHTQTRTPLPRRQENGWRVSGVRLTGV